MKLLIRSLALGAIWTFLLIGLMVGNVGSASTIALFMLLPSILLTSAAQRLLTSAGLGHMVTTPAATMLATSVISTAFCGVFFFALLTVISIGRRRWMQT